MVSNTRLYGAAIAFVSGGYSVWSASMTSMAMTASGWVMLLLGIVVVAHGAVLLTGYADRLGDASGPLMVVYALAMLVNQVVGGMESSTGMGTEMGMATSGMGWDPGMVALAVLMLASGLIMTRDTGRSDGM